MPDTGLTAAHEQAALLQQASLLEQAERRGDPFLLENESLDFVGTLGIATPQRFLVESAVGARRLDLAGLRGERVVVKAVARGLTHKTEVGAVAVVSKSEPALVAAIEGMARGFENGKPEGFLVLEFIEHPHQVGGELLLSLRWTDDFGPVVTLGPGGTQAEVLSQGLDHGRAAAILSPCLGNDGLHRVLATKDFVALAADPQRGQAAATDRAQLAGLVSSLFGVAARLMPQQVAEIEINPLTFREGVPVALDALVRRGEGAPPIAPPRPLEKMRQLLQPRSLAIMGVSTKMNPGRIVLDNVLAAGYDPERVQIIKAGHETLAGCRCVPDLASLSPPVDLAVLCIGAAELPTTVAEIIEGRRAETLILIAGGLGERSGSESRSEALTETIFAARESDNQGPLINGGNCLGIRSIPGGYDTLFIPRHKLSHPRCPVSPLALISQSGALAVAKASSLAELNPRYLISLGNQLDLTVADYLTHLDHDPAVGVFACYVEGFRPLDGKRWLERAAAIVRRGRPVILYRAGRSEAGGRAAATHTASIAGDYAVTRELAEAAGVLVADTLDDFQDLIRVACALHGRELRGRRLGALSNAGFECVAMADGVRDLELATFSKGTTDALEGLLARHRLSSIVGVGNPLDVTPILDDAAFAEACRLVLEDDGVDLGVVGCVPLTGALQTLATSPNHGEDITSEASVVRRLARLWEATDKPWVAAVDSGPDFDPMARQLAAAGLPVFRSVDRALRLLEIYAGWRLRDARL